MRPDEGRPPAPVDAAARKYLFDKLAEVRKSCEWLLSLGAANVLGNLLKSGDAHHPLRTPTFILVSVQMLLALIGALAWLDDNVDPAQIDQKLRRTLHWRYRVRNTSMALLVAAYVMLLLQLL